jgi:hypothetical protein
MDTDPAGPEATPPVRNLFALGASVFSGTVTAHSDFE